MSQTPIEILWRERCKALKAVEDLKSDAVGFQEEYDRRLLRFFSSTETILVSPARTPNDLALQALAAGHDICDESWVNGLIASVLAYAKRTEAEAVGQLEAAE